MKEEIEKLIKKAERSLDASESSAEEDWSSSYAQQSIAQSLLAIAKMMKDEKETK